MEKWLLQLRSVWSVKSLILLPAGDHDISPLQHNCSLSKKQAAHVAKQIASLNRADSSEGNGVFQTFVSQKLPGDWLLATLEPEIGGYRYVLMQTLEPAADQFFNPNVSDLFMRFLRDSLMSHHAVQDRDRGASRLDVLMRFGNLLPSTLELDELYWKIYQLVSEVMDADAFFVGLLLDDEQLINHTFLVDEGKRYPRLVEPLGPGVASRAIQTRKPVIQNRTKEEIAELEKNRARINAFGNVARVSRSLLACPIIHHGEVIGVISTQSYRENAYSADDASLLDVLASQIGTTITNAELYQEQLRRTQILSVAEEVDNHAWGKGDTYMVITTLLKNLKGRFEEGRHTFFLRNEETHTWEMIDEHGHISFPQLEDILTAPTLLRTVYASKRPAVKGMLEGETWLQQIYSSPPSSALAVPMLRNDEVMGILLNVRDTEMAFSAGDSVWYEQLLTRLAATLERIQYLQNLAKERDKFLSLVDHLDQGVHIIDANCKVLFRNQWSKNKFRLSEEPDYCYQIIFNQPGRCEICPILATEKIKNNRGFEVTRTDGSVLHVKVMPFTDSDGEARFIELIKDVTQEKKYESEKIEFENLKTAIEFAGTVAHELNQPLTGITGLISLVLETVDSDDANYGIIKEIENQAERMENLIARFLKITRIKRARYLDNDILDLKESTE